MTCRRHGGDKRGSSRDRRARKLWMLSQPAGFGGDGTKVPCVHCGCLLAYEDVEADRIQPGGSYARQNIQPACRLCNLARSDNPNWQPTLAGVAPETQVHVVASMLADHWTCERKLHVHDAGHTDRVWRGWRLGEVRDAHRQRLSRSSKALAFPMVDCWSRVPVPTGDDLQQEAQHYLNNAAVQVALGLRPRPQEA